MMQDKSKKLLSEIVHQKHMQKQPVKAAIRNMWAKQTSAMQISNMEQQRASPQRNQEENNQATIIVPNTQE